MGRSSVDLFSRKIMNSVEHKVFVESKPYPIWCTNARERRERNRMRIRQQTEAFINQIGAENVLSVTEHPPTFGPFYIVVWWSRSLANTDTPVARALDVKGSA